MELILASKKQGSLKLKILKIFNIFLQWTNKIFIVLKSYAKHTNQFLYTTFKNKPYEIEDPYYGDDESFEIAYNRIYQGCKKEF